MRNSHTHLVGKPEGNMGAWGNMENNIKMGLVEVGCSCELD
jgi:hypothetical protein